MHINKLRESATKGRVYQLLEKKMDSLYTLQIDWLHPTLDGNTHTFGVGMRK